MSSCGKRRTKCRCHYNFTESVNQTVRCCYFDMNAWRLLEYLPAPQTVQVQLGFIAEDCLPGANMVLTCEWPGLIVRVTDEEGKEYRVLIDGTETVFSDGFEAARFCRQRMTRPEHGWWPIDSDDDEDNDNSFDIDAGWLLEYLPPPQTVQVHLAFADDDCFSDPNVVLTCEWPELSVLLADEKGKKFEYRVQVDGATTTFTNSVKAVRFCRERMVPPEKGWWKIHEEDWMTDSSSEDDAANDETDSEDDEDDEDSASSQLSTRSGTRPS